ncbi:MAG: DHH family phosphoesterase [bacterium]
MIRTETVKNLKGVFKKYKSFLLLTHINPEPDTIGSALALYHYLKGIKKDVSVYNEDGVPNFLKFMPHTEAIKTIIPNRRFEVVICMDAGSMDMLGERFNTIHRDFIVNIDHHKTNAMYGDLNIVDPCASATCELMYVLFKKAGIIIDQTMAGLLLAGIVYDTGSFKYRNTTYKTLRVASELIRLGANIGDISENLYETLPLGKLKLLEMVLKTLELSSDGRIASVEVTRGMYQATGTTKEEAEGLIDYPKSIKGVDVAVLFREVDDNKYKVSLRSKNDVDVSCVAEALGGGGHKNAAGCTIEGRLFDVKNKVFTKIVERLK